MSEIRVDNITDEAGIGAPEITDHYKKSNILGTVSESGGVPTGAVIESGSNSNGDYVRYADGTQIVWSENLSTSTGEWTVFSYTYPISFSTVPNIQMSLYDVSIGDSGNNYNINWDYFPAPQNPGTSGTEYVARRESNNGTSTGPTIFAVGRWY